MELWTLKAETSMHVRKLARRFQVLQRLCSSGPVSTQHLGTATTPMAPAHRATHRAFHTGKSNVASPPKNGVAQQRPQE